MPGPTRQTESTTMVYLAKKSRKPEKTAPCPEPEGCAADCLRSSTDRSPGYHFGDGYHVRPLRIGAANRLFANPHASNDAGASRRRRNKSDSHPETQHP